MPTPAGVTAFVLEPNIGLVPHAPAYALALGLAVFLVVKAVRAPASLPLAWWWPAVIQLLLLALWSQNPNANHGGTPGVNRWVLSLLALSLPWFALARDTLPGGARLAMNALVAVLAVMSAAAHLPAAPENYRTPTRLAERMWRSGIVHISPAEVFAERTQGREPAFVPTHDGTCRVLLIAEQQAPAECPPPAEPLPGSCRAPGSMCYAVTDGSGTRYAAAPMNGFFHRAAPQSWPAGGPLAQAIGGLMTDVSPSTRVWRVDNSRRWREVFAGTALGMVLSSPDATIAYVLRGNERMARRVADEGWTVVPLVGESTLDNVAVVIPR